MKLVAIELKSSNRSYEKTLDLIDKELMKISNELSDYTLVVLPENFLGYAVDLKSVKKIIEDIFVYKIIGSFDNSTFHVGSNINVLEFTKDEMRVFTQRFFSIFKKRYMDRHINFMKMIYDLTPASLEGDQTLTSQETIDSSSAQKIKNGILATAQK